MHRYFFDIDDDDRLVRDDEGLMLTSDEAARKQALAALPGITGEHLPDGDRRTFVVAIRNEAGEVIYRATLSLKGEWVTRNAG